MLLRRFTDFILQNRLQAMGLAFVMAFIPIISGISILIAALVTLRKGVYEGALVAIAATLPCWIGFFAMPSISPAEAAAMAPLGVGLITAGNFLTWMFAGILRRYHNWSSILELSIVLGILSVIIAHIIYPDIQNQWATQLNSYLSKTVSAISGDDNSSSVNEVPAQLIASIKAYATGLFAVSVLFNALLQLALARWWQAIIFNPGGLRVELRQIRLNYAVGMLFVAACMLAYFSNAIVLDVMPVFFALFAIAGLSLAHGLAALTKMAWLWLVFVYVGIVVAFQPSVVILAMAAFLDIWMDFRKRFRVIER